MRTHKAPKLSGMAITSTQAAEIIGLSPAMISHYCKAGIIPVDDTKRITLGGAMQGIVSHLRQQRSKTSAALAINAELQEARLKEVNLRIAEREGRLMDVNEINHLFTVAFANFRIRLSSIPNRCTRDAGLRHIIETEIDDAMAELADWFLAESARLQKLEEAELKAARKKFKNSEKQLMADADLQ